MTTVHPNAINIMPTVNVVGLIASSFIDADEISVTWAIVPGESMMIWVFP
jgi:hypothetical protein